MSVEGDYRLEESFVRSTPFFTLYLTNPDYPDVFAARVFIQADYRFGVLRPVAVTVQSSLL